MNKIGLVIKAKFGKSKLHLSESVYSDVLEIPKKTFGKYLRNEVQPRIDELQRISTWLGVELWELL